MIYRIPTLVVFHTQDCKLDHIMNCLLTLLFSTLILNNPPELTPQSTPCTPGTFDTIITKQVKIRKPSWIQDLDGCELVFEFTRIYQCVTLPNGSSTKQQISYSVTSYPQNPEANCQYDIRECHDCETQIRTALQTVCNTIRQSNCINNNGRFYDCMIQTCNGMDPIPIHGPKSTMAKRFCTNPNYAGKTVFNFNRFNGALGYNMIVCNPQACNTDYRPLAALILHEYTHACDDWYWNQSTERRAEACENSCFCTCGDDDCPYPTPCGTGSKDSKQRNGKCP